MFFLLFSGSLIKGSNDFYSDFSSESKQFSLIALNHVQPFHAIQDQGKTFSSSGPLIPAKLTQGSSVVAALLSQAKCLIKGICWAVKLGSNLAFTIHLFQHLRHPAKVAESLIM